MKTASWFVELPPNHVRVGISRASPRRMPAGFRMFRPLAPGPWFNSVDPVEYDRRYRTEILDRLDPHVVAARLLKLAGDGVPVLVCFERPGRGEWCHRSLCATWLAEALGTVVPEFGHEHLPQSAHPLWPPGLPYPGRR